MTYSTIKPIPYYSSPTTSTEHTLAKALRADVTPMIKRLLPVHHLGGVKHDFVIEFIRKHSSKYRYFLRTDITKFYPSIRHTDVVVGAQIASSKMTEVIALRKKQLRQLEKLNEYV